MGREEVGALFVEGLPLGVVCAAAWPGVSAEGWSVVPFWDGPDGGAAGAPSPDGWSEPGPDVFTRPDAPGAFTGPDVSGVFTGPEVPGVFTGPGVSGAGEGREILAVSSAGRTILRNGVVGGSYPELWSPTSAMTLRLRHDGAG
ncbi:hypothetical protein C1J01_44680 [Nonomuraea aridisoli]|uniref:Uncharacterized protein n=1 Tax=Nonomuraea aridisoli TaxID=2070368 RepID=A0A2W2D2M9_9ACTN|nr:hypothetical protein C1J01_44680 [Nonomuraea aridisoli]